MLLELSLPKLCVQMSEPLALEATPTPVVLKFGFSMLALWPEEPSQPFTTDWAVV